MKKPLSLALLALTVGCASWHTPTNDRYPNQVREPRHRDPRTEARRDRVAEDIKDDYNDRTRRPRPGDRDPYDRYPSPRYDDYRYGGTYRPGRVEPRHGREWRMRGARRCIGCFDRSRYQGTVDLGSEHILWNDQFSGARSSENMVFPTACGIRSVSVEVLDNEAQITGLEVHYAGAPYHQWDRLPIHADWDFRNGSQEGENSMWFDVGSAHWNDRTCIDKVRVTGFSYKDFYDFGSARVQVYGSRTQLGASSPYPGGYNPGPQPTVETRRVELAPNVQCVMDLPPVQHPDELHSDEIFGRSGSLRNCKDTRDRSPVREMEARGFLCTKDDLTIGQTDPNCVSNLNAKVARQNKITGTHRDHFQRYCSGQIWNCSKTVYR